MSTPISTLKEEVKAFGLTMLYKLGLHRNKGHWSSKEDYELMKHLRDEVDELTEALQAGNREKICSECGDVANLAMMIHNNAVNGTKAHRRKPLV